MQLERLLLHIVYKNVQGTQEREIADICYHSGRAGSGSLFVCLRGQEADGHEYLPEALERGAEAVVVEEGALVCAGRESFLYAKQKRIRLADIVRAGVTVIVVEDGRETLARLSAAFFDYPAKKLRMIGITGTKGKTTTAYLTAAILRAAGYRVGMVGTISVFDGKEEVPAERTTPESYELQRYLARMAENGCDCCVMEVSSQGLKLQRVAGIWYDIGIFLNLEPDHIGKGEHASFAEYLACKSLLFRQCSLGIVNRDDRNTDRILWGHTCAVETFSMRHPAAVTAEEPVFAMREGRLEGRFLLRRGVEVVPLMMQLPGSFNIYNALAAAAAAFHFGVDAAAVRKGLATASVPGRCENVSPSGEYVLLIDYAHNEMSLRQLLEMLRGFSPHRLIVLFGCGGNRSGLRRARMGETAGHLADLTILTSDNPRWEDPEAILDDIEAGIRGTRGAYVRITDRGEAVRYAIGHAEAGDIIVLAGKGHEPYQEIRGVRYPMSEYELIERAGEEHGEVRKDHRGYLTGETG